MGENKDADQQLISAFVFATRIVHFIFFLNPKFQASSLLLTVQPDLCQTCSETTLLVFPRGGSNDDIYADYVVNFVSKYMMSNVRAIPLKPTTAK